MSALERRLVFAARARADVQSIALYGRTTWGKQRPDEDRAKLNDLFVSLTRFPDLAHQTPPLTGEGRMISVGSHIAYYRSDGNRISIVRVLHKRARADDHLD